MIIIFGVSDETYIEIINVMPNAIKNVEQDYNTVNIEMTPATDIDTNNILEYVTLKHGTKFIHINYSDFHYIKIS